MNELVTVFGNPQLMLGILVFLAATTLAFTLMAGVRVRRDVKRRAASLAVGAGQGGTIGGARGLRESSIKAAKRLLDYTTKHYGSMDSKDMKVLRRRLVQAGFYDPRAVSYFFAGRTLLAIGLAVGVFIFAPLLISTEGSKLWLLVGVAGVAGYVGPSMYLDRRIKANKQQHLSGFPDFLDLLVVCADSGLSMEAALDRVGRELADGFPSLCANIHMTNLEIRAGRSLTEALDHLAERLAIEEARSFATLIQQSTELGSSITEALRVYSEDMRHKRLSRAEEKAYALPAKLSIPMMVCIFPVLFVVILLPVIVRLMTHHY
ncbi:MAG TPA: type II secretion system F family protein [Xanthobacteraceae bacterium]|nr:type II secretion system F family protein [Xanthobacteraceae bacterium]